MDLHIGMKSTNGSKETGYSRCVQHIHEASGRRRSRRARWITAGVLLITALVLRGGIYRPAAAHPGAHYDRGANAAWLGIEWVHEPQSPMQIAALAAHLRAHGIRDAYVYTSYLRPSGQFGDTWRYAPSFTSVMREAAPAVRVHAWLGVPLRARGWLVGADAGHADLADESTRQIIAAFARQLVREGGFGGVHLDPEPATDTDPHLLMLLEEVRAAVGPGIVLSIATPRIRPFLTDVPFPSLGPVMWSGSYYREVARRVDQVALMTYDSALPHPMLYRQWGRFQVIALTRALEGSGTEVLIGIPTSRERTFTHRPEAETMESGLQGTIDGLNDAAARPQVATGVAIYPYWEADANDWRTYRRLWLAGPAA